MVAKKIRTEYMKKFKDPKWETYSKCYEDMLRYRTTRRLLEHAHNPWFWEGWESGSESSGSTSPQNQNKVEPLKLSGESPKEEAGERPGPAAESEEAAEPRLDAEVSAGTDGAAPAPQRRASRTSTLTGRATVIAEPAQNGKSPAGESKGKAGSPSGPVEPEQSGAAPSTSRPPRKAAKGKSQPRESAEPEKENKHPFALYGWAEKQAETGLKKTHNVRPAASTKEGSGGSETGVPHSRSTRLRCGPRPGGRSRNV
ncbi:centriole, cilia and spindle-associated protein isoform X2 [Amia ocellicauda]|uniref:centriole, cilia and spindle-associated protein isoform X2 n=1 Tax=Amia ocellicauda TaxID=2972642 RepID=UPI003464D3B2